MNSPKQKPISALIRRNFTLSSNTILTTYKFSQMSLRTMTKWHTIIKKALLMESTIFTAEVHAIDIALNIISEGKHKKFIIFLDLFSFLLSLSNKKLNNPLIITLLSRLDSVSKCKEILICWIPSSIGVKGNVKADLAARSALGLTLNKFKIPYIDLKPKINKFFHTK